MNWWIRGTQKQGIPPLQQPYDHQFRHGIPPPCSSHRTKGHEQGNAPPNPYQ